MKFNINEYGENTCMHCNTEQEAKEFLTLLHNLGKKWCDGASYIGTTHYSEYTVYYFNQGVWAFIDYANKNGDTVLEWSDFKDTLKQFTKADLKTGDICKDTYGGLLLYIKDIGFVAQYGSWISYDFFEEDLSACFGDNDIVEVRRPKYNVECKFNIFKKGNGGEVVYRRKPKPTRKKRCLHCILKEAK